VIDVGQEINMRERLHKNNYNTIIAIARVSAIFLITLNSSARPLEYKMAGR